MKITNRDILVFFNENQTQAFESYTDTGFKYKITKLARVIDGPIKDLAAVQPNRGEILKDYLAELEEYKKEALDQKAMAKETDPRIFHFAGETDDEKQEAAKAFIAFDKELAEKHADAIKELNDKFEEFENILDEEVDIEIKPFLLSKLPEGLGDKISVLYPFIIEDE
jgi:hypothetical protein